MDTGLQHPHMNWETGNLTENWKRFKQHAELMFSGPYSEKSEEEKCSYLLIWVGEKGRDVYNSWEKDSTLTAAAKKKLTTYHTRFANYVQPKTNQVFERFKFYNRLQQPQEKIEHFVTELNLLAQNCGFTNPSEMIRDRIVFGVTSTQVREKLFNEGSDLTLEKAVEIARNFELSKHRLKKW